MSAEPAGKRPVFLDPFKIKLPVTATVSLAHRISGIGLAIALPFLVWALALSLRDAESYARVAAWLRGSARPLLVLLAWALAHHSAAGVRHLLFDAGIGTGLHPAVRSAWTVHALAVVAALIAVGALW